MKLDDRDTVSAGWKFNEWELKGVPLRLELGPRDLAQGQVTFVRRDTLEKGQFPMEDIAGAVRDMLEEVGRTLYRQAEEFKDAHTYIARNMEELTEGYKPDSSRHPGAAAGNARTRSRTRRAPPATHMPFDQSDMPSEVCVCCGKPAAKVMPFAKAY